MARREAPPSLNGTDSVVKLKEAFREVDENQSGTISTDKLREVLRHLDPCLTDQSFRSLLDRWNGVVEYDKFVDSMFSAKPGCRVRPGAATLSAELESLIYVSAGRNGPWQLRWRAPSVIRQVVVGCYDAFALVEDGSVWSLGRCEDGINWGSPAEPQPVLAFRAKGKINRLCIDYTSLIAITWSGEVWVGEQRCGGVKSFGCTQGLAVCCGADATVDPGASLETFGSSVEMSPLRRLDRLCSKGVVDIAADGDRGLAVTADGGCIFFANAYDWDTRPVGLIAEDGGPVSFEPIFADVELPRRVKKAIVPRTPYMLLDDGTIAFFEAGDGKHCARLIRGDTSKILGCHLIRDQKGLVLPNIIDISDPRGRKPIALDRAGRLWSLRGALPACVINFVPQPDLVPSRLVGGVAVAVHDGGEVAFAVGQEAAVMMASAGRIGFMTSDHLVKAVAWFDVEPGDEAHIGESIDQASRKADAWARTVVNRIAADHGALLDVPTAIPDTYRLAELLVEGANPQVGLDVLSGLDGSDRGELLSECIASGMSPGVWSLLVGAGADPTSLVEESIAAGDVERLDVFQLLGHDLTSEERRECQRIRENELETGGVVGYAASEMSV